MSTIKIITSTGYEYKQVEKENAVKYAREQAERAEVISIQVITSR